MATRAEVAAHRLAASSLSSMAISDLVTVWRTFTLDDAKQAEKELAAVLPLIIDGYGTPLASLSADWYDDLRDEAKANGIYRARPADLPSVAQTDALAGFAVGPLYGANIDDATSLTLASGGLKRLLTDVDANTTRLNVKRDPAAKGWHRVTSAGACKFCRMLEGRGNVYKADTANFGAHDHCACTAVAAFNSGPPITVEQHIATQRNKSAKDRERLNAYLNNM